MGRAETQTVLVGVDVEGDWNLPLLENAAAISGASFVRATARPRPADAPPPDAPALSLDRLLADRQRVFACEVSRRSRSVFETPAPRGRLAVLVGNERAGLPRDLLRQVDGVLEVPMRKSEMTSVNVAAAAAVLLYVFRADLARRPLPRSRLGVRDVDILLHAPDDPSELGSLLRSAWSFGWDRAYVSDPHGVWFSSDRATVIAGRAAARRAKNPLVIAPANQLSRSAYDFVVACGMTGEGTPLSRLRLPSTGRGLVEFGASVGVSCADTKGLPVSLDLDRRAPPPRFRLAGSILLSVVASALTRGGARG